MEGIIIYIIGMGILFIVVVAWITLNTRQFWKKWKEWEDEQLTILKEPEALYHRRIQSLCIPTDELTDEDQKQYA